MAKWSSGVGINLGRCCSCRCSPHPASTAAPQLAQKKKKGAPIARPSAPRRVSWALAAAAEQRTRQELGTEEEGVVCEGCEGRGWLLCGFCNGKKNKVKSPGSSRIYRRCPTCKAAGCVLCSKCRVYKCITFPDNNDGDL